MKFGQISHYLNIPPTTVRNTIAKGYQEDKENDGRGRHSKTTKLQDEAMVEEALKNRHTTYFKIGKKVASNVSTKTVKRRIAQKHLKNGWHKRESIWMKIWLRRGWNGHWTIGTGQERCGEGRHVGR